MGETKVDDSVEKALKTQLLDIGDLKKCEGSLVHIEGGDDMTLEDVNRAGEIVVNRISPNAKVSWGARINSKMQGAQISLELEFLEIRLVNLPSLLGAVSLCLLEDG